MKTILISFADNRYRKALERLEEWTKEFPFTERHFHTERNTFTRSYWRELKPWLYRRGYGYWEWKGKLVKQYLEQMDEGDILVWSDVGVYWNASPAALRRFSMYVKQLTGSKSILAFQEPYIEKEWTKGDLLEALNAYDDTNITNTLQLWSGCFFIQKTQESCEMIDKWASINERRKELETDHRSTIPNLPGFKEHRHDQSSFSVLVKQMPHIEVSWKETQPEKQDNWESLIDFPIQARRHKLDGRPLSVVLWNKVLHPWRSCLNFYFRHMKQYEWVGDHYPW